MAWRTLRDTGGMSMGQPRPGSFLRIITSAVLINLLNPKLTLFFFALLPQFVDASGDGTTWQMTRLGGVFMAVTLVIFVIYGLLASVARDAVLSRPRFTFWLRRLFAASFASLGARLLVTER